WGLEAAEIGRVTADGMLRVREGERVVAELPARLLSDEAPVYERPLRPPTELEERWQLPELDEPAATDAAAWTGLLERMLTSPNLASRRWVYEQYDYQVRTNTVIGPGADAAVLRIPGSRRGLALTTDGNGRLAFLDPYRGGMLAVAEAARNVACVGARPLGLTNCLNFGNPERPEIMWQFSQVIDGMAAAAAALGTPVTGGNVSFYNETMGENIYPTPVIGMVGVIDDVATALRSGWRAEGDRIVLLGPLAGSLAGSEYLRWIHRRVAGRPPAVDLELERRLIELLLAAHARGWLRSAHDLADGGLAVALAECCLAAAGAGLGAGVQLPSSARSDELLFGEAPSRVIVSVAPDHVEDLLALAAQWSVPACSIGVVGGTRLDIAVGGVRTISANVSQLADAWNGAIGRWMS
ncbi:MAG TPA: AIR synthase related protein, partial [Bacillota bacterium]